jgi:hypothetical protein
MRALGCQEVALETEACNAAALGLYERLGFAREERLLRYYLNGGDAFRLKLWLPASEQQQQQQQQQQEQQQQELAGGVEQLSLKEEG